MGASVEFARNADDRPISVSALRTMHLRLPANRINSPMGARWFTPRGKEWGTTCILNTQPHLFLEIFVYMQEAKHHHGVSEGQYKQSVTIHLQSAVNLSSYIYVDMYPSFHH